MPMGKIALFCKSYEKDLYRAKRLADSIDRFNVDNLSFYMSVPQKDLKSFQEVLKENRCYLLTDEEIVNRTIDVFGEIPGYFYTHLMQQLIKLEFWRMDKVKNYAWVDSDSYFIREFSTTDFIHESGVPYTIFEEFDVDKRKKKWCEVPIKIRDRRIRDRVSRINKFKTLFGKETRDYNFGVSTPIIWSSEVLEHLYQHYLIPNDKTIFKLLLDFPCETYLYGYYLMHSQCIPVYQKKHMFKAFDYLDEFVASQIMGENEYTIAKEYYGICFQSNWALFREKKEISERLRNRKQEIMNFFQNLMKLF